LTPKASTVLRVAMRLAILCFIICDFGLRVLFLK
jgi:hypothetical protein